MKTLARRLGESEHEASEVQDLQWALDQRYAQLRERAQAEWQRRCSGHDPSDACICVRIGQAVRQQALTT
jgi:hypothetical protein